MIIDNGYNPTRVFELISDDRHSVCNLRFPKVLFIFRDSEYPASPIGYKDKGDWVEVFLKEALKQDRLMDLNKSLLISSLSERLYSIYRDTLRRCSKDNESFVRRVIHLTLTAGFNGEVYSITDRDLAYMGMNRSPARTALRKLHDLGIIVFLAGYGLPPTEKRNAIPMGFMARPDIDCLVENTLAKLEGGKMCIADIKDINLDWLLTPPAN